MKHAFIDTYANLDTPLHRADAKIKLILFFIFLLVIIFTSIRYPLIFLLYAAIIAGLIYLSKVPLGFIFKRTSEILPFVFIISLSTLFRKQGVALFLGCSIKAIFAVVLILTVIFTIRFAKLLEALRQLRLPTVFIDLLSFMYRYSFVLEDQILRTQRAYVSRNANNKNKFMKVKILSNILGTVFIRTYERAERIYLAMCARGYADGKNN